MSSAKKLAISPVTAGIRKIEPATMPSAAAIESTHDSTVSGVVVVRPKVVCTQVWPPSANQTSTRCSPIAATTISSSAMRRRFQQHLAERRREHLGERFECGVEHGVWHLTRRGALCRGLRARSGSGNVARHSPECCRGTMSKTDAPIVPRRRGRRCREPGARRDPAEIEGAAGRAALRSSTS